MLSKLGIFFLRSSFASMLGIHEVVERHSIVDISFEGTQLLIINKGNIRKVEKIRFLSITAKWIECSTRKKLRKENIRKNGVMFVWCLCVCLDAWLDTYSRKLIW